MKITPKTKNRIITAVTALALVGLSVGTYVGVTSLRDNQTQEQEVNRIGDEIPVPTPTPTETETPEPEAPPVEPAPAPAPEPEAPVVTPPAPAPVTPPAPTKCPEGTVPNAVDDYGNESNCQVPCNFWDDLDGDGVAETCVASYRVGRNGEAVAA